jgi:hypothetical protein
VNSGGILPRCQLAYNKTREKHIGSGFMIRITTHFASRKSVEFGRCEFLAVIAPSVY